MLSVVLATATQLGLPSGQALWQKMGKFLIVPFLVTPTNVNTGTNANPYVAGGDTLDLTQLFNLLSSAPGADLPTACLPLRVEMQSVRGQGKTGSTGLYVYQFSPGTTLSNGTMQIFTGAAAQSPLAELSAGNYPANVLNDSILAVAWFPIL